jgi:hypothetical protein
LFNSSSAQILSLLTNDFFRLSGFRDFSYYKHSPYLKLSSYKKFNGLYLFHVKYYNKLLYFFWDYFDSAVIKIVFYYYFIISRAKSIHTYSVINLYLEKARHTFGWFVFSFYERLVGKVFASVNRFEDYYDMNFDKSANRYNFYLSHINKFFGSDFSAKQNKDLEKEFPDNVKNSVRFSEYIEKLAAQRKKDYLDTMADFFTGSFSFFGHFYVFVRDNIFEFVAL